MQRSFFIPVALWRRGFFALVVSVAAIPMQASGHEALPNLAVWHEDGVLGELQLKITSLKPGDKLVLPAGVHEGPIIIRTNDVTIEGEAGAAISGHGRGSVIKVKAQGVTLKNIRVIDSGSSYDQVDAGISVNGSRQVNIERVTIEGCLFGIDIMGSEDVTISNSVITSKHLGMHLRGDAIRSWASKRIKVLDNAWSDSRDVVSWYSEDVVFERNSGMNSRYSVHSMYSKNLSIVNNRFSNNSVGIFIMYGENTTILDNTIERSLGAGGLGIGMKETSRLYAKGNRIFYSGTGILVDNSPWTPGTWNWFIENKVAFNRVGVYFTSSRAGNEFARNIFADNLDDVDSEVRRPSESRWLGNYWGNYNGFDRNGDGVGDTPYIAKKYGDLLSGTHPMAFFFFGSPVLALIELIERLVPLTSPIDLLRDDQPYLHKKSTLKDVNP